MILVSFKIVVIFNTISDDIKTKSANENNHNEDRATLFLKLTEFKGTDLAPFVGNVTTIKIPSEIKSPLGRCEVA